MKYKLIKLVLALSVISTLILVGLVLRQICSDAIQSIDMEIKASLIGGLLVAFIIFVWFTIIYGIIPSMYYKSKEFINLKNSVTTSVQQCNEVLKELITEYAESKSLLVEECYHCSREIVANAKNNPYKYLFKYFDLGYNEETIKKLRVLFDVTSSLYTKELTKSTEYQKLFEVVHADGKKPIGVNINGKRFLNNIGLVTINCIDGTVYNPYKNYSLNKKYILRYTSPAGNSGAECVIELDCETIQQLLREIYSEMSRQESHATQRKLMTNELRERIKARDNYTCQSCGASIHTEPHLLLEVDHIIPIAKGGKTEMSNLQTLCWMCNRKKGAEIV